MSVKAGLSWVRKDWFMGMGVFWTGLVGMIALGPWAATAFGAEAGGTEGNRYAILIGVEKYQEPKLELVFCHNDVDRLAEVLREAGYQIWRFTEREGPEGQPTRTNLMERLPGLLRQAGEKDTLVLYFTGHGFVGPDGRLYLATWDCQLKELAKTALAAEWLREQLAACRAKLKLLVLDACHAGCQKGPDWPEEASAKGLAAVFERTPGVYTLASCQQDQKSLIWDAKRQSLFSYWLVQGLRGPADREGRGEVRPDDLYQYLDLHVPRVAQRVFGREQRPDRAVGPGVASETGVVRIKPRSRRSLLAELAEQIATILQIEGVQVVGVPEFAVDAKKPELELGRDFGVLGRLCATDLSGLLAERSGGRFRVVAQDAVQEALCKRGITPSRVRTRGVQGLQAGSGQQSAPIGALILGILRSRVGSRVMIQCEVWDVNSSVLYGSTGGEAELTEEEWAILGPSVVAQQDDYRPAGLRPISAALIERLDQRSRQGHPMQDPQTPYRVYVVVDGQRRPGKFVESKLYVPVKRGEQYEIHVELKEPIDRPMLMRLLVDGLSTLPEPERIRTRGIYVEPVSLPPGGPTKPPAEEVRYVPAQRVSLEEASAWLLDPNQTRVFAVRGFAVDVEKKRYWKFEVVDAAELPTERREFTNQLGIITAAFYDAVKKRSVQPGERGPVLATRPGPEATDTFETYSGLEPGRQRAVINIHYIAQEEWDRLPPPPVPFGP